MRKILFALALIGAGCFGMAIGMTPASAMDASSLATIGTTTQANTGVVKAHWRHHHHRHHWRHRHWRPYYYYRPYRYRPYYYRPYRRCWWEYGYRVCRRY